MDSKIACVIVNYNGIDDTAEVIESLNKSTCQTKIIVIDNASANDEGIRLEQRFPDIQVIKSERNVGFAGANNLGIKYALEREFEYIMLLNNDTVVDVNMISELLKYSDGDSVLVPTIYYYYNRNEIWFAGGKLNRFTGRAGHIIKEAKKNKSVRFATGCCMLIPRQVVEKVGLLDETYFMYHEDVDYSIRLIENKVKIIYIPSAHLWHKIGRSSDNISNLSLYYSNRNRLYLTRKNKDFFFFSAFPLSLLTRYIRLLQSYIRKDGKWKVYRKAIHDYFCNVKGQVDSFM